MSQSSDSSDDYRVVFEPGSPSDAESGIYCDEEFSEQQSLTNSNDSEEVEQQSMAKVPQDSEEAEQQSKANPHDQSGLELARSLPAVTNAESLKETSLEPQTNVTEFGPADPHSCVDVADCDQQGESGDVAGVRIFTPRNFSFQELLNSNAAGCLNSNRSELGVPSDAANEVKKRIPDHNNNDWKVWLINREGDRV